jgi:hypothetical protein
MPPLVVSMYLVAAARNSSPAGTSGEDMRPKEGVFRWAGWMGGYCTARFRGGRWENCCSSNNNNINNNKCTRDR